MLGEKFANSINAYIPGNHEDKGDLLYQMFKAVTNGPGGMEDPYINDTTGSFTVGDVCFVILNTEPLTGVAGADAQAEKEAFYAKEKAWAREMFEASGKRWRIILAHAGLIQDDLWATRFLEDMCDELDVDLYFNGHIHDYYRATAYQGAAAEVGQGTTFITTSPMGCKFDDFVPGVIDDLIQFQTGGSQDQRQYFTYVRAGDEGLTVTSYQRARTGEITNPKIFTDYAVIDSLALTQSLSEARGHYQPAAAADPEPEQPTGQAAPNWAGLSFLAAGVLVVVSMARRKSQAAKRRASAK
jgi:hypothetical protein